MLSSLLTGMPAAPVLPSMTCELIVYGLVSGALGARVRTGRLPLDLYVSLVGAMLAGRVVGGALQALIFSSGSYSLAAWVTGYILTGLPGIVLTQRSTVCRPWSRWSAPGWWRLATRGRIFRPDDARRRSPVADPTSGGNL